MVGPKLEKLKLIYSKLVCGENFLIRTNNSEEDKDSGFEWFVHLSVDKPTEDSPHHIESIYKGYGNSVDELLEAVIKALEAYQR